MDILYDPDNMPEETLLEKMKEGAALCVMGEGIPADRAEVSLTFASGEEIRTLNRDYRGVDRTTDVLSFPQYEDVGQIPRQGEIPLGDVVICREQAIKQAGELGHSKEREIIYLFIHSICHLLGYDHLEEGDKRQMRKKEEAVMEKLRLAR